MSKCDLSIELETGTDRHQPGDVVRGHVLVEVNANCTCKKLDIVLQWRTHGRGNRAKGEPLKQTLFEGAWRPGEQQRYPFEFTIPAGPLSYHGEVLNVDWYINVTADIPWAFDPKAETEIFVHRGSYTGPLSVGDDQEYQKQRKWLSRSPGNPESSRGLNIVLFVIFGPVICIGISKIISGFLNIQKDPSFIDIVTLLIGIFCILMPAIILVFFLRWGKMRRKLGNVQVAAEATDTGTGTKIFCAVTFTPQASVVVNRISADLVGKEVAVSGSGTRKTTYAEEFHREGKELMSAQQLVPRNPVEEIAQFDLPADTPTTFFASSNRFIWFVDLKFDIPSWPDYEERVEITVPPEAPSTA